MANPSANSASVWIYAPAGTCGTATPSACTHINDATQLSLLDGITHNGGGGGAWRGETGRGGHSASCTWSVLPPHPKSQNVQFSPSSPKSQLPAPTSQLYFSFIHVSCMKLIPRGRRMSERGLTSGGGPTVAHELPAQLPKVETPPSTQKMEHRPAPRS